MAVEVDIKGIEKLREDLKSIDTAAITKRCGDVLMSRLLRYVIKATPVGQKPEIRANGKNKKLLAAQAAAWQGYRGGTLRRGWRAAKDNLQYVKYGNVLSIKAVNPTYYGDYVEHGHRQHKGKFIPAIGKKLVRSYVPGRHFAQKSEDMVQSQAESVIVKETEKAIKEALKNVQ